MIGLTRNKTYKGFLSQELPIITIINDYGKTYELKPNFFNAVPTNNVSLLEDQIASTQSILSELQEKLKIAKLSLYVLENTAIGAGASKVADQLKTALGLDGIGSFSIREGGNLNGKGLYLSEAYNWSIETDNVGCSVLVIKSK